MTSSIITVVHETEYAYASPVDLAHHQAMLRPLENAQQRVMQFEMDIDPLPSHHSSGRDVFGNSRAFFTVSSPHQSLVVRSRSTTQVDAPSLSLTPDESPPWEKVRESYRYHAGRAFAPEVEFIVPSPYVPLHDELRDYARMSFTDGAPLAMAAIDLMRRIHEGFDYQAASTTVATPIAEAFRLKRGVCQDFAHVMIGCLRSIGLAARYVSGYLLTRPREGAQRMTGADASHAWVAVACPGVPGGWLELDPTNDVLPGDSHVRLAVGRDYGDVAPVRGVIRGGGEHSVTVRVSTTRL